MTSESESGPGKCPACGTTLIFRGQTTCQHCGTAAVAPVVSPGAATTSWGGATAGLSATPGAVSTPGLTTTPLTGTTTAGVATPGRSVPAPVAPAEPVSTPQSASAPPTQPPTARPAAPRPGFPAPGAEPQAQQPRTKPHVFGQPGTGPSGWQQGTPPASAPGTAPGTLPDPEAWNQWQNQDAWTRRQQWPPRRTTARQSGANWAALVAGGFVVVALLGIIGHSGSGQGSGQAYDTPYMVFDTDSPPPDVIPADTPETAFVPATFPAVDPLVATGALNTARSDATATLLPDGRVIVIGGAKLDGSAHAPLSSVESYESKTGKFSPAGDILTARMGHTATLLQDGTILVAGGEDEQGNTFASAEIYDPDTAKSHPTGDMTEARTGATSVLLDDGSVLVMGGFDSSKSPVVSAELYDPATGTFTWVEDMPWNGGAVTAVKLQNGVVLVAGGQDSTYSTTNAMATYDPASQSFGYAGRMLDAREGATSCLLPDAAS
jgi:hypothetical protein